MVSRHPLTPAFCSFLGTQLSFGPMVGPLDSTKASKRNLRKAPHRPSLKCPLLRELARQLRGPPFQPAKRVLLCFHGHPVLRGVALVWLANRPSNMGQTGVLVIKHQHHNRRLMPRRTNTPRKAKSLHSTTNKTSSFSNQLLLLHSLSPPTHSHN